MKAASGLHGADTVHEAPLALRERAAPQPRGAARDAAAPGNVAVLHLVRRVTDTVFSFLGPATLALAEQGFAQTVVLIDDPRWRHQLTKFHNSVRLVLVAPVASPYREMQALLAAYREAARARRPMVAHLHGLLCSVLGLRAAHVERLALPTYFTPHGSRLLAPLRSLGAALPWALKPLWSRLGGGAIASSAFDALSLHEITRQSVRLVESPVHAAFFDTPHSPGAQARVLTASRGANPAGAALFAQCAVLLAHQTAGQCFGWIGAVDAESAERLKAAQVQLQELNDDAARAQQMAGAWVFVAPLGLLGFPVRLAEAMALGLPCVAWDTPYHRDLVRHGDTGLLCRNVDEALVCLADLLESPDLRQRIGAAARDEARARFDGSRFREALLGAYGEKAQR